MTKSDVQRLMTMFFLVVAENVMSINAAIKNHQKQRSHFTGAQWSLVHSGHRGHLLVIGRRAHGLALHSGALEHGWALQHLARFTLALGRSSFGGWAVALPLWRRSALPSRVKELPKLAKVRLQFGVSPQQPHELQIPMGVAVPHLQDTLQLLVHLLDRLGLTHLRVEHHGPANGGALHCEQRILELVCHHGEHHIGNRLCEHELCLPAFALLVP